MPELIGQPASILKWYATVLVACHCQKDHGIQSIVIVTGVGNSAACGNCGKLFVLTGFKIEGQAVVPVIDIALPTAPGKVM